MATLEQLNANLEGYQREVKTLTDDMGPKLDRQAEQIQQMGSTQSQLAQDLQGLQDRYTERQNEIGELKAEINRLTGVEGAPGLGGGGIETHGAMFTGHENFTAASDKANTAPVKVPGFFDQRAMERHWLTSNPSGMGGAGSLIQPLRRPEVLTDPRRTFIMRDLMNVIPVQTTSVEIIRQSNFYNFFVAIAANAAAAQNVVVVENVSGMYVGQTIIVGVGTGTPETRTITAINQATRAVTVNANFTSPHPAGEQIVSDTLGATQPGALKPEANIDFAVETVGLTTLAHWIPVHRQTLDDIGLLRGMIDTELLYGLALAEEEQLLFGSGSDGNLRGLMNHPGIQDIGTRAGNDNNGTPLTYIDWIRKAMTLALIARYPVNGIVLNPMDDEKIEMQKDTTGQYLFVNLNPGREPVVWGIPKVVTISMPAKRFLAGSFGMSAELYDREEANIRVSEHHADFFIRNAVAVLAEERIGIGVKRPESFVKGQFEA